MGAFNSLLLPIDSSSRQKPNRETLAVTDFINQMDWTDIYSTFQPNTKEYTFFLAPHEAVSKIVHILRHKVRIKRYKEIEITPCILSDLTWIKTGCQQQKQLKAYKLMETEQFSNKWKVDQDFPDLNENEDATYLNLWDTMKAI